MYRLKKLHLTARIVMAVVFLVVTTAGFAAGENSARIIPSGKVSIIKDGKIVGEFSQEVPFPEGSLLRCEERCTVKLDDLYMVAEPQTTFSVAPQAAANELTVRQGTVYYLLPETSRPLQINTPPGDASIREFSVTDSELKGYVLVSSGKAEIGVIYGGVMTVETSSGEMVITPGKQITIALVNSNPSAAAAGGEEGSTLITDIALGAAGVGVLAGGAYLLSTTDGNKSSSAGSPSSP